MKEKGDVPNLPPEFNPIIPLRDRFTTKRISNQGITSNSS